MLKSLANLSVTVFCANQALEIENSTPEASGGRNAGLQLTMRRKILTVRQR